MDRLVQEGIISGYADGTIRPDAAVTKAELAVMLYKVLEKSQFDMTKINDNLYANYQGYYWEEEEKLLKLVDLGIELREETSLASFMAGFRLAWGLAQELETDGLYSFEDEEEARACRRAEEV